MTLLQIPESATDRYISKSLPIFIQEHEVRNDGSEVRRPISNIEIQITIIVQVTKIGTHCKHRTVQSYLLGHVLKGAITFVSV